MALDVQDKNYIDDRIERYVEKTRVAIRGDMEHFFGVLRDDFNHKFSILVEISRDKPNREESRLIAEEEANLVFRKQLNKVVVPCVKEAVQVAVDATVGPAVKKAVDDAVGPAVDRAVARYYGDHERRIRKLEAARI